MMVKLKRGKDRTPGGGKEFYETDPEFYDCCNAEFHFGLDAAADKNNAKCKAFISKEQDAIGVDWLEKCPATMLGKSIWLNPPYSRGLINEFLRKCLDASQRGATVVVLLHTCTDTKYWQDYVWDKAAEVRHIRGRLRFWFDKTGNTSDLPHSLVVYRPFYKGPTLQTSWDWKSDYISRIGPLPVRNRDTREITKYVSSNNDD